MKKILGIIGGMGPLATANFLKQIVLMTDAKNDQDHIRTIIDNNTDIPDRTDYILNHAEDPVPALLDSAKKLESLNVSCLVMPCNTAHFFYDSVKKNVSTPFLNMIEETASEIKTNYSYIKKAGLLATEGTCFSGIYEKYFSKYNIDLIKPDKDHQQHITDLIYNMKRGAYDFDLNDLYKTLNVLTGQGSEIFILGCTELSVAFGHFDINAVNIDPTTVLARSAIRFMGKKLKEEYNS